MITLYPYAELGHADHGWLDARHHFSFARYYNPKRLGFGALLVINDDKIAPQTGFGAHAHDNMEIITYVRSGAITHQDNMGNKGRTAAGDVQVMSAGSGVTHAEHNLEDVNTTLYQIWIRPNQQNVTPRWDTKAFPKNIITDGSLPLLVSGHNDDQDKGALFIHQDAAIYGGRLQQGSVIKQPIRHNAYILASSGSFTVNGQKLSSGDGAEITDTSELHITADQEAEILVIDVG